MVCRQNDIGKERAGGQELKMPLIAGDGRFLSHAIFTPGQAGKEGI